MFVSNLRLEMTMIYTGLEDATTWRSINNYSASWAGVYIMIAILMLGGGGLGVFRCGEL